MKFINIARDPENAKLFHLFSNRGFRPLSAVSPRKSPETEVRINKKTPLERLEKTVVKPALEDPFLADLDSFLKP